ncbi:hypothetical protein ES703_39595 [subsurface metagenome]
MDVKSGLTTKGFYELRDSTCKKCLVKFDRREENGKVILVCPKCGGNIGRLKQKGVLK